MARSSKTGARKSKRSAVKAVKAVKKRVAGKAAAKRPKQAVRKTSSVRPKAEAQAQTPGVQRLDPTADFLKRALFKRSSLRLDQDTGVAKPAKKTLPRSPLAPARFPDLPVVSGLHLGVRETGLKYKGRPDLLVAAMPPGTAVAGAFTQSATAAAPVQWCRTSLETAAEGRLLIVNAGNANAFTGPAGLTSVKAIAAAGAAEIGCRRKDVFIASTGVIGVPLDHDLILPHIAPALKGGAAPWEETARAIMTTDTFPKAAGATVEIGEETVNIVGLVKGSGMIAPNLATMLGFLFTDAAIPSDILQTLLLLGVRDSFNAVTVDSDTSTNDTLLAFATGAVPLDPPITRPADRRLVKFRDALHGVMLDLALQLVRDGEGASKLIRVEVTGAANTRAARGIARAIADSPLVKTAIAGRDANWGRVVMAVGKSGEKVDPATLEIRFGEHLVARKGAVAKEYNEAAMSAYMRESEEILIAVDLGAGAGAATVWTCDLTHGYIDINADYRS